MAAFFFIITIIIALLEAKEKDARVSLLTQGSYLFGFSHCKGKYLHFSQKPLVCLGLLPLTMNTRFRWNSGRERDIHLRVCVSTYVCASLESLESGWNKVTTIHKLSIWLFTATYLKPLWDCYLGPRIRAGNKLPVQKRRKISIYPSMATNRISSNGFPLCNCLARTEQYLNETFLFILHPPHPQPKKRPL